MESMTRIFGSRRGVAVTRTLHANNLDDKAEVGPSHRTSEAGSSLVLALIYIISTSLIVGALADWAMNDLTNTTHFQTATSIDNAVSGAAEVAIQSIRYYPQFPALRPGPAGEP